VPMFGSLGQLANEVAKSAKATPKLESPAFGGLSTELVYIPLTPCRFIDTRNVGGPLAGTRGFDLDLTGSTYGGSAACDPSASVSNNANNIGAIAINVAIVSPTVAPGFIGARPAGATTTTALVNWYESGAAVQASNAGVVTTDQTGAANEIEFFGSATQFIVDVFGVFAAPTATALDCIYGTRATSNIPANGVANTFAPACPVGYTKVDISCDASSFSNSVVSFDLDNGNSPYCAFRNTSAVVTTGAAQLRCCRIPGR